MTKPEIIQWVLKKGGSINNMDVAMFRKGKHGLSLPIDDMSNEQWERFVGNVESFIYKK
jgi:hypothetical protein